MLYCPFSFSRLIFNRGLSSIKNQKKENFMPVSMLWIANPYHVRTDK